MSGICVKNLTVGMVETNCCLVYNEETKQAVIVDPGDAADVIREECRKLELSPELILLTLSLIHIWPRDGSPMFHAIWIVFSRILF